MDLDFFLDLDEARDDRDGSAARDRDIYRQIDRPGLDDTSLILSWLDFRRLLYFHEAGDSARDRLPGTVYTVLYQWMVRAVICLGVISGLVTAYSFLAYHGSRPVNVTLFIAFFILLQAFLSIAAGTVMIRWIQSGGRGGSRYSFFHTLVFRFFMKKFHTLAEKAGALPGEGNPGAAGGSRILDRFSSRPYLSLIHWSFFITFCLGALGFSLGALGSTLLRVMVAVLAFGWQSTLFTSGDQIHNMVNGLALPWSWILPDALPSLDQIEGSRIILKQGIQGLVTENLTAWWPLLGMGILVYGVMPRLILAAGGLWARQRALAGFDFTRPRYKRLVMRMQSARMDTDVRETGGTQAQTRAPLPAPDLCPVQDRETDPVQPRPTANPRISVPVLASERVYPDPVLEDISRVLDTQLGIDISGVTRIDFEFDGDTPALSRLARTLGHGGPIIILQEVWQPPIRGLLYYFVQIRQEIFQDHDIWIFLTQTPGTDEMGVDTQDMDYQIWQTAVSQLKDPGIILERWVPDAGS